MPYKDPEKQKAAKRASALRRRQEKSADRMGEVIAVEDSGVPKVLPDPPDEQELIRLLGVQARLGSVQAAKLLLDRIDKENRGDDRTTGSDPLAVVHELAERRRTA